MGEIDVEAMNKALFPVSSNAPGKEDYDTAKRILEESDPGKPIELMALNEAAHVVKACRQKGVCPYCSGEHIVATNSTTGCCDGERMDKGFIPHGGMKLGVSSRGLDKGVDVIIDAARMDPFTTQARKEAEEAALLGHNWSEDQIHQRAKKLFEDDRKQTPKNTTPEWMSRQEFVAELDRRVAQEKAVLAKAFDKKLAESKQQRLTEADVDGAIQARADARIREREEEMLEHQHAIHRHSMDGVLAMGASVISITMMNVLPERWKFLMIIPMGFMIYKVWGTTKRMKAELAEAEEKLACKDDPWSPKAPKLPGPTLQKG